MKKERNEFTKAIEVVALHIERYSRQVDRLLSDEDYDNGKVGKTQYYRQRNKKIKAYFDAIDTMIQKERLLQFHASGWDIKITEEKTEINMQTKSRYDFDILSIEELKEILELINLTKKQQDFVPLSITPAAIPQEIELVQEAEVVNEPENITFIKTEESKPEFSSSASIKDPRLKLQEAVNRIAAKKFGEVGTLTEEEESLYPLDKVI